MINFDVLEIDLCAVRQVGNTGSQPLLKAKFVELTYRDVQEPESEQEPESSKFLPEPDWTRS